ncbi:porphobilinogen deaminase [Cokeromyces recurvatus]|uniref:porphobilinogen deaminase n=1 Tax=Cokeromyces recurvatus TaxID=90255 RepID=UPI00221EB900|nr:porphobilinogen deaminase [Cokeromyces recurvatus]KAI7905633.1 porphobilinogen deaminase [Cokeromyces recurvatus]
MAGRKIYRIGTRKSQLALVQTEIVRKHLQDNFPDLEFLIEPMSTTGDRILNVSLSKIGEKSLFTKELEVALAEGRVDLVVHSLKDLPTVLPDGMFLGAVMERENPNDALVLSPKFKGHTLATLPKGSVIGTSSLRRVAQLKRRYPHLVFKDTRGNINTRLAKLDNPEGEYAAIVLAVAGLVRINMGHRISQVISSTDSLHAVSQGALGIECRENDFDVHKLLESLNHHPTYIMCSAERSLMRQLEGGCSVPIGVNSSIKDKILSLHGLVSTLDGQRVVEFEDHISLENSKSDKDDFALASKLGIHVAKELIKRGADTILAELAH